eukprot:CAMPEP_0206601406 /NCGR_PEP_ID=MMETSP0325_2-20121206/46583_1 /ASSEMBLY_ACC=CAM_ASM_000347 /TAXON_ID=2866 /ORGANISM="Crypthecodinium cohnii, Strain Seligo" /LENGTH=66 /DNA_ID=CAMNT_0054113317 /DNA_START=139 /DNA_END=336 /DNA_ORIENTATION=-
MAAGRQELGTGEGKGENRKSDLGKLVGPIQEKCKKRHGVGPGPLTMRWSPPSVLNGVIRAVRWGGS